MEDLLKMMERKSKIQESPNAKEFQYGEGGIEFKGVSFGHKLEQENDETDQKEVEYLFKDFDLSIKPGTTNAIVGPSGFGKTTMLQLIYRIFDPD